MLVDTCKQRRQCRSVLARLSSACSPRVEPAGRESTITSHKLAQVHFTLLPIKAHLDTLCTVASSAHRKKPKDTAMTSELFTASGIETAAGIDVKDSGLMETRLGRIWSPTRAPTKDPIRNPVLCPKYSKKNNRGRGSYE